MPLPKGRPPCRECDDIVVWDVVQEGTGHTKWLSLLIRLTLLESLDFWNVICLEKKLTDMIWCCWISLKVLHGRNFVRRCIFQNFFRPKSKHINGIKFARHLNKLKFLSSLISLASAVEVCTEEIHRLDQWILDWTTAVAGKADMCQLSFSFSFTYHSSGPI